MATVNNLPLLSATITERIDGPWLATGVEVDSGKPIESPATIEFEGVSWVGMVSGASGVQDERAGATIIGGAGGLDIHVDPLWYANGPRLRRMIDDLLRLSSETLSDSSSPDLLGLTVPQFQRRLGTVRQALAQVTRKFKDGTWRILRDGTLWVGVHDWPGLVIEAEDVLSRDPAKGLVTIAPDSPTAEPGTVFEGERVVQVDTVITPDSMRQILTLDGHGGANPMQSMIANRVAAEVDYTRLYSAKVLGQSGGLVDIMPDDDRIRGRGITGAKLRHGMPGVSVTLKTDERCLLGFENGDPSAPYVGLWPQGSGVEVIQFGGGAEAIALAGKTQAALDAIIDAISNAVPGSTDGGAALQTSMKGLLVKADTDVSSSLLTSD